MFMILNYDIEIIILELIIPFCLDEFLIVIRG
jgi:hypothetical protein